MDIVFIITIAVVTPFPSICDTMSISRPIGLIWALKKIPLQSLSFSRYLYVTPSLLAYLSLFLTNCLSRLVFFGPVANRHGLIPNDAYGPTALHPYGPTALRP